MTEAQELHLAPRLSLDRWSAAMLTVLCVAILAAFVASELVYKIWYICAAVASVIALLMAGVAAMRVDGLLRALVPLLVYLLYLAAGSLWAEYPLLTLTWVGIDAIEIPVLALFYLWALNATARQICWAMIVVAYLALPINVSLYLIDQDAQRFGGRGLAVLPVLVPFCWIVWRRERNLLAFGAAAIVLAMLLISRSRTPLGAALAGLALSILATGRNRREVVRGAFWVLLGLVALVLLLLALPVTRPWIGGTFARLVYQDVNLGDVVIPAEAVDEVRWGVFFAALQAWWDHQPLGMGYMNFMLWFERIFGLPMNLHMSLQTWAVEGGLPCLAIVAWMFVRYFRLLRLPSLRGDPDEEALARTLRHAMMVIFVLGLFHQPHQAPMMYALLGIGYAFAQRYERPHYLVPREFLFEGLSSRRAQPP